MTVDEALAEIGVEANTGATFGGFQPRDFQIAGAKAFVENVVYGLYDQTGVGKTLTLFLSVLAWRLLGNKVVLMTKPGLFNQLLSEWDEIFIGLSEKPSLKIGSGILLMTHAGITISRYTKAIMKEYDVLVIDEYHKFRNPEGRRFKTLKALTSRQEMAVMIATGTPITKDLRDSYSCVSITNPTAYKSFYAFCKLHVAYRDMQKRGSTSTIRLPSGFKNEKLLRKRLGVKSRRLMKADVWPALEAPMVSTRYLSLTDSQKRVYEDFQEYLIYESTDGELFDASYSPTLKFSKGIMSITNPAMFEQGTESCVLADILLVADSVAEDNKLIIFTLFDTTATYYAEQLEQYNPALITGSVKQDVKFKEDDSCKVLVSTLGAGAEGYSFQKVSSHIYLAEYMPVPGWLEQAANRVYRPGQLGRATLYLPHVKDTLYVTSLLKKSRDRHESNCKVVPTDFSLG